MNHGFDAELAELKSRKLYRSLREVNPLDEVSIEVAGKKLLNFSSNDYLGFSKAVPLVAAAKEAADRFGVGAGAARLVCGTLPPHVELEHELALFKQTEAALAFSSGYAAAVGVIGALAGAGDVLVLDKLCHASLIDGAKLSGATVRVFPHNHLGKLESHLQWARRNSPNGRVIVVTESVFSMDGDRAPLAEIVEIKNRHGALLMVDEAHAVGVIGDKGRGLADKLGIASQVDVHMGTLGKALGVSGGYICGSKKLIDWLINRARSFIYSTAPSPVVAATAVAALKMLQGEEGENRRRILQSRLRFFSHEVPAVLFGGRKIQSAIIPVILNSEERAMEASQWLGESGFFVPAIRYPTVPKDSARLRITFSASHSEEHVRQLVNALKQLVRMFELEVDTRF